MLLDFAVAWHRLPRFARKILTFVAHPYAGSSAGVATWLTLNAIEVSFDTAFVALVHSAFFTASLFSRRQYMTTNLVLFERVAVRIQGPQILSRIGSNLCFGARFQEGDPQIVP